MTEAHFTGLGGADEIGASCSLYHLPEGDLLIDAGVRPGLLGEAALPRLELLRGRALRAMVLTHAHLDHLGALPLVVARHPQLSVYCTPATARLAALGLADTLKVSAEQGAQLYTAAQMKRALERLRPTPYFTPITEHGFGLMLIPAGHLLGAASVAIDSEAGSFLHTGDVNNIAAPSVGPAHIPNGERRMAAVVMESTYGATTLPARKEQLRAFMASVHATLVSGGRVLIPSFALGRAQDVMATLASGMDSGVVQHAPIYLDGMTRQVTAEYDAHPEDLPPAMANLIQTSGQRPFLRRQVRVVGNDAQRRELLRSSEPAVVLASSGMLHAGVSPVYARAWLPDERNALLVVGHQDAESPGRRLLDLERGGAVSLPDGRGERVDVQVAASVERYYLSAHADRPGLLAILSRYPTGKVLLTHGDLPARMSLQSTLGGRHDVTQPALGETVDLSDSGARRTGRFVSLPTASAVARGVAVTERHARLEATLRHGPDGRTLIIELPEGTDLSLIPEGAYKLEAVRHHVSKLKFSQRLAPGDLQETAEQAPPLSARTEALARRLTGHGATDPID